MAQQDLEVRPLAAKPSRVSFWSSKRQPKTTNYWSKPHHTFINPSDWVPGENLDCLTHPSVRPAGALGARKTGVANRGQRGRDERPEADITPDDYGTPCDLSTERESAGRSGIGEKSGRTPRSETAASDRNHDPAGPDLVTHAPPNPVPASSPAPNPTAGHQGDGRLAAVGPGQHEASGGTTNAWHTSLGRSLRPRPRPPVNTTADMGKTNKQPRRQGGVQEDKQAGS
ncbi:hypothetical protein CSOJ01_01395 [Colletotrichum sojae]|uniref:Uncharacterized protein n=1 Tax=Colletotrichum sojae TaxID=2175907 RepID=A0A8H6JV91_9PEZI|nr:hypothetical protein CSOJ01_01395 [Colletotrichum sojae]